MGLIANNEVEEEETRLAEENHPVEATVVQESFVREEAPVLNMQPIMNGNGSNVPVSKIESEIGKSIEEAIDQTKGAAEKTVDSIEEVIDQEPCTQNDATQQDNEVDTEETTGGILKAKPKKSLFKKILRCIA